MTPVAKQLKVKEWFIWDWLALSMINILKELKKTPKLMDVLKERVIWSKYCSRFLLKKSHNDTARLLIFGCKNQNNRSRKKYMNCTTRNYNFT